MGLSGSKTSTTSSVSAEAKPYLTAASSALQGAYDANRGNTQAISGGLFDAFKNYSGSLGSNLTGARDYATGVLGAENGSNPHLDSIVNMTNNNVADRINALFSRSGQTGSSRQIGELGARLAENESGLRYTDFNNEQARKAEAANLLLGVNNAENANMGTLAGLGSTAVQLPWTDANNLAAGLGSLWGNQKDTTQKQGGDLLGQLLNAGASIGSAALMASDRRLKRDIRKVGALADGLGIYVWRYIWGGPEYRGVMADEVAALRPWALGPKVMGEYMTVDYSKLGAA